MTYTLQIDRSGNMIVCRGTDERNAYTIVSEGSYQAMLFERAKRTLQIHADSPGYRQRERLAEFEGGRL